MSRERSLRGRLALVTGGTRGIGAATTEALAGRGASVVATYRSDAESATAFAGSVSREQDGVVSVIPYDLAADPDDASSAEQLLDRVQGRHGVVDILVANASSPHAQVALAQLPADALVAKAAADIAGLHRLVVPLTPGMR